MILSNLFNLVRRKLAAVKNPHELVARENWHQQEEERYSDDDDHKVEAVEEKPLDVANKQESNNERLINCFNDSNEQVENKAGIVSRIISVIYINFIDYGS